MNLSPSGTTSDAAPRRVLGDLAPKSLNATATRLDDISHVGRDQTPLKQALLLPPRVLAEKENHHDAKTCLQPRKRTISEVDDAEEEVRSRAILRVQRPSVLEDGVLTVGEVQERTMNANAFIAYGSPTECNTPTPLLEEPPEIGNSQNTQGSSLSFSKYLDYGQCVSQQSSKTPPPEEALQSRAELLRARLGLGIYKVKTNQIGKRDLDVIADFEAARSLETSPLPNVPTDTKPTRCHDSAFKSVVVNLDPGQPIRTLLPGPLLLPTKTSSRSVCEYDLSSSSSPGQETSQKPLSLDGPSDCETPVYTRTGAESLRENGASNTRAMSHEALEDSDLTGSVVRGYAAKGLMELMASRQ